LDRRPGELDAHGSSGAQASRAAGAGRPSPPVQHGDRPAPLRLDVPYVNDGPRRLEDQGGSYALPDAATVHNVTVEFGHSLGEVVTSAAGAGLVVQQLGENLAVESDVGRSLLPRDGDGLLRWRQDGELLPVVFSLLAGKPG